MNQLFFDPRMALGAAGSAALIGLAAWIVLRRKLTPDEKERRRRDALNQHRRTVEGFLAETGESALYYHYEIAGVEYSASQDVTALADVLPVDLTRLMGPVNVKYDPRNPANSIIICESWSGLPAPLRDAATPVKKEEPACN